MMCFLLGTLLVCVPGGTKTAFAGKKRREASIDRLRDRSASDRWNSLQKLWQPFGGDQSPPADGTAAESLRAPGEPSSQLVKPTAAAALRPAPPAAQPVAPLPAAAPQEPALPVWVIEAGKDGNGTARKGPVGTTVMTSLQEDDATLSPSEAMEKRMAEAAQLKPITDILPYRDYIPAGTTDPSDELCLDGGDGMNCPTLAELPDTQFEERIFMETHVAWEPSNLFSNPLYFEDASLERYGHTHGCLQPLVSLGKFSAQLVGLPYQMALHPIHERRYALGWYRPGECAPHKYYLPPWNTKAAITAGAAYTGLIFLIP